MIEYSQGASQAGAYAAKKIRPDEEVEDEPGAEGQRHGQRERAPAAHVHEPGDASAMNASG